MDNKTGYEYENQQIIPIEMEKEVKQSFIEYSMSVIVSRALPDVRDGMKPGQRRILYAMYEDHLTSSNPFRKSVATVGNVLGRYHPHGDTSVYMTLVRMAQPFSYRYPLIEGHGNFGNVDGDGPAAYRYTEARMAKISDEMMRDLDKDVVKWNRNFDNKLDEPDALPSRFPNLLVNGSVGIAVGMATNIPPHNLGEVIDGTVYLMDNPNAGVAELMQFIKGPDFPTRATIYGGMGIQSAYATGRGKVMVRARAEVEEDKRRIIVSEIPYMVNKTQLLENIAHLVRDKRIDGITELRDESGRAGMRIVVEYRRDANGQVILNQLYKYSQLQDTCAINMLALVKGEPRVLSLKQILEHYISFQEDVISRRVKFELDKAMREAHIYEGYKIALDHIDEIISIIRASEDTSSARESLRERFDLSELQAQSIVDMTLGRLSGMERKKIEDRLVKLYETIEELTSILGDSLKIKAIIKEEILEIKRKFSDERRTEIVEAHDEIVLEDLIERHECVITMTHGGYIKRQAADVYSSQRRGGKGIIGMATKEEDFIEKVAAVNSHSNVMLFTNTGKVHILKAYRIPEASRTSKGGHIVNLLELAENEKITAFIAVDGFPDEEYLLMVTKKGVTKRTQLAEFEYQRKGGKIALSLDDGDELLFVGRTFGTSDLMIATKNGNAVRYPEQLISCVGRTARGVRGIKLREGDEVAGASLVDDTMKLVTITEGGFGKRTEFSAYDSKGRGNFGVICHKITEKTGKLTGIATVADDDDLMLITNDGTIIRTPVEGIPVYGRAAGGVIVMRLGEGASIVNFTATAKEAVSDTGGEPDAEE